MPDISKEETKEKEVVIITPCSIKPRAARETFTPIGSPLQITAKLSFDDAHHKVAEPGEVINLDKTIQSYKGSTDIATIVARYKAGDESVINVKSFGFSGDLSVLPHDINDITGIDGTFVKVKNQFNALPNEVKSLFNNSVAEFFNAVINNKVDEVLSKIKNPVASKDEKKDEKKDGDVNE